MKKVLLTGATGFVGAYLAHYLLQKGYAIRAIRRPNSPMQLVENIQHQLEWVEGDLLDPTFLEEVVQGVDQVYHAAALVSFNPRDQAKLLRVNGQGTAFLVNAALLHGVEKLLHVSSIAALGRKKNQGKIDEQAQWENNSINSNYAISKFKAECEVWRGIEEGLNAVIINPSMIMGAGFWNSGTSKMFMQVDKKLRVYPQGTTGFVDVRDVATAAIQLMESDISGQRFILNAENWSYYQLFSEMANGLGKKAPSWKMPGWMIELMWRMENFRSKALGVAPLVTKELARAMHAQYEYEGSKIQQHLGFQYRTLSETIEETCQALQQAKALGQSASLLTM